MKNLIFQVQIPEDKNLKRKKTHFFSKELYAKSMISAQEYAKKVGAEYLCIKDHSFLNNESAAYQRIALFDMDDYDYIFYIDSDAIVQECCPDIFKMGVEEFAAVPDFDPAIRGHKKRIKQKIHKMRLSDLNPFCSGVMLTTLSWRRSKRDIIYKLVRDTEWADQDVFNIAQDGTPYTELHSDWGAWYKDGKYINHYGGSGRKKDFTITINDKTL